MAREVPWFRIIGVAALLAVATMIVLIVRGASQAPNDVQPISWHHQPCAHCQMLISEPVHAAQLITTDGDVLSFDDPGCALSYVDERHPQVHRLWFHHSRTERWLAADRVGFTTGGTTPMASGLLAVDAATPGALGLPAARDVARASATTRPALTEVAQ